MKVNTHPASFGAFISIGIIAGATLSWLTTQLPLSGGFLGILLNNQWGAHFSQYTLFFYWIVFYGLMFLLAYPSARSYKLLIGITFIPSLLAAGPYCLTTTTRVSLSALLFFSAYALNAFHIHYQTNGFRLSYHTLFHAVWDTFVKLCISVFFTILCWIILWLCGQLFKLIGINVISHWLSRDWFGFRATPIFVSIGLYIATVSTAVIDHIRKILLVICQYLLVPLAIVSIVFAVAALFSLRHYHTTDSSQFVFSAIAFLSILFLNGVYQDGSVEKFYPPFLFWICRIFLWITPIFTLLALYTLLHDPHNTMVDMRHFSSIINLCLLLIYNVTYAIIAMRQQKPLFKSIQQANVRLAIFLIVLTVCASIIVILDSAVETVARTLKL